MAQSYGNTWWGNSWLKSLTHIDYANRIPRGAAYARKGSVKDIQINGNEISAKVAGSRPKPYRVFIRVPAFTKEQTDRLMNRIIERPALISKLLNRELDPEILNIAKNCGLQVFPTQWNDLQMYCNCPDWAVPCKHLAAVIYMMSREIDNNPFLIFEILREEYARPIQVFNDRKCAERFRNVTAPFMMRRLKSDKTIIADLPDKIEQNEFALLTKRQAALYEETLQAAMKEIEGIEETDSTSLFKRQGLVLQMILALKQICNHPAQFLKNGEYLPELSGKSEMLLDLVNAIVDSGEKVLIFTQFREMGEILQGFIEERTGERPMFYHGGCSVKQRQEMVDRFQTNRADKVFLLSLKAAGTGLNLTAASHVIHYDLWWNPAVEAQATDRAYRIGQHQNVMVHRFITKNTFEERIDEMIQQKKQLADLTVAAGESWIGKMSNKELRDIFG